MMCLDGTPVSQKSKAINHFSQDFLKIFISLASKSCSGENRCQKVKKRIAM